MLMYRDPIHEHYTVEPLFNGHLGTSKVSLRKEVPFIERSIYTQLL